MEQYIWKKLGISASFSIEERLFMSTSFLSACFLILLTLPLYIQQAGRAAFYLLVLGLSLFSCYLLVRLWRRLGLAKILLTLVVLFFSHLIFPLTGFFKGPVVYGLVMFFVLSLAVSKSNLEQRVNFILILIFGLDLIFYLAPMPDAQTTWVYFLTYFAFTCIFYLGTVYLKMMYDQSTALVSKQKRELEQISQRMEKQMVETKELSAQKDRLFSIIGHDLRSPLSGIEGFLNVMDHGGVPDEERKIMQNELLRLTRNSRALLDNLLRWAKRDTKAYEASRVDYPKLIKMVGEHLRPLSDAKGISLQILIDEGEGTVTGDSDMLEMIIRNLISNAIKFTPKGGWIKVRAYEMESELKLEVEDNGIGMTEEQRKKLFSPHREVGLGTNKEKGVGLGLMLCAEFLNYMNGTIEVRSVKDKGSCFTVRIPRSWGESYNV